MRPSTVSLPNGLGLLYPYEKGKEKGIGARLNELTPLKHLDKFVGFAFHKFVPARLEAV